MRKVDWDAYFLKLAFSAARRSIDRSTKVGCILVSQTRRVLGTAYNGPMRGADDAFVDSIMDTRPDKYYAMIHAEENAVTNYSGSEQDIRGSSAYVTCDPCHRCLRMLIQRGVTRVVYIDSPRTTARMIDAEEKRAKEIILKCRPDVQVVPIKPWVVAALISEEWSQLTGTPPPAVEAEMEGQCRPTP